MMARGSSPGEARKTQPMRNTFPACCAPAMNGVVTVVAATTLISHRRVMIICVWLSARDSDTVSVDHQEPARGPWPRRPPPQPVTNSDTVREPGTDEARETAQGGSRHARRVRHF